MMITIILFMYQRAKLRVKYGIKAVVLMRYFTMIIIIITIVFGIAMNRVFRLVVLVLLLLLVVAITNKMKMNLMVLFAVKMDGVGIMYIVLKMSFGVLKKKINIISCKIKLMHS